MSAHMPGLCDCRTVADVVGPGGTVYRLRRCSLHEAAPDLLAALEYLIAELDDPRRFVRTPPGSFALSIPATFQARVAVAKAKGEA